MELTLKQVLLWSFHFTYLGYRNDGHRDIQSNKKCIRGEIYEAESIGLSATLNTYKVMSTWKWVILKLYKWSASSYTLQIIPEGSLNKPDWASWTKDCTVRVFESTDHA